MLELSITLAFSLLLLAVALLFARTPSKGKRDWPLLLGATFVALAVMLLSGAWQYSKLMHGTSIFSLLGQTYGLVALVATEGAFLVGLVVALWRDFGK